ncbi:MAG: hypothetical protein F6K25_02090 [Okeania sp. SIO2G4]|nr:MULTISPECIES: hypothetical protein [unclassified Okeania]NEP03444.1 hypothetical protein [Okeania sp. SIO4D6]NEP71675.1 hypothetical protein [Okeania sp. SIO2G5]NEP91770.1 hypothetical protein [Okeania sp. SIO2F5]NEQ89597.1 hypothetical protein [Okeania sp. SIO2G4]
MYCVWATSIDWGWFCYSRRKKEEGRRKKEEGKILRCLSFTAVFLHGRPQ